MQREGKIKEVEKEITKAKAEAAKIKAKSTASKQALNELTLEIESLKTELSNLQVCTHFCHAMWMFNDLHSDPACGGAPLGQGCHR